MALFKPRTPKELAMLRAGMCPECGATVTAGMKVCPSCRLDFGEHAAVLTPPPAAPPSVAGAPPPRAQAPSTSRGLSDADIDELERGQRARSLYPHSGAEGPEAFTPLALGGALVRGAQLVMATAALVDDVMVLAGGPTPATPLPRTRINHATSSAAMVDDAPPVTAPPPVLDLDKTQAHDPSAVAAVIAAAHALVSGRGGARPLE